MLRLWNSQTSAPVVGAIRIELAQLIVGPYPAEFVKLGLNASAKDCPDLRKGGTTDCPFDKSQVGLDPITDLLRVQRGGVQPDFDGSMLPNRLQIQPVVAVPAPPP